MNSLNNNAFSGPTTERFEATKATQSEAVAGSDNKKYMTPLRTFQGIAAWVAQNLSWATLSGKPTTFPPAAHTHATSEVTGLDAALAGKAAFQPNPEYAADAVSNITVINTNQGFLSLIFARQGFDYYQSDNEYAISRNGQSYGGVAGSWVLEYVGENGGPVAVSTTSATYPWQATWPSGTTVVKAPLSRLVGAPLAATAAEGTSAYAARADHVHPFPTAAQIGAAPAGSYVTLDGGGKVSSSLLPSYVDDVIEVANFAALPKIAYTVSGSTVAGVNGEYVITASLYNFFPTYENASLGNTLRRRASNVTNPSRWEIVNGATQRLVSNFSGSTPNTSWPSSTAVVYSENSGQGGKIYVVLDTGKCYRWSGSTYIEISSTLELDDLQLSDAFASVYANVPGFTTRELPLTGTLNGKPQYTGSFGGDQYDVYWTGTNWKAQAEYNGDGYSYGESIATGNTPYPWQATGWTNGGGVTRVGTYNAALAPAPLGADGSSGIGTKAAREDHVHPLPTPAQIGSLSLSESSYIIAKPGDNLAAKYTAAKALTPNGEAKSATNRASLIIFPGSYSLSSQLGIDADFVDIIGLGAQTQRPIVLITAGAEAEPLNVTADDLRVSGISVGNNSIVIAANKPSQVFENCVATAEGTWGAYGTISGTFINCVGGDGAFGGYGGTASGTFTNCTAGNGSFGGTASGAFKDCTAGAYSFGYQGPASGTFANCTAGGGSFGGGEYGDGGTASGKFTNCTAGDTSFGGYGPASGTFKDCTAGAYSFGYQGPASGTFANCTAGGGSFGCEQAASGIFTNCRAGGSSFGAMGGTASGTFTNCTAEGDSFGGTASGTFKDCTAGAYSFGYQGASGTFTNCTAGNGSFGSGYGGTASGTFTNCTAGNGSFGSGVSSGASGKFMNCKAGDGSFGFGSETSATGIFTNCTAGGNSFGGGGFGGDWVGAAAGTFTNCTAGNGSFGWEGAASGTFTGCVAGSGSFGSGGLASGKFANCRLTAGTYPSLTAPGAGYAMMTNCLDGNGNINNAQEPL